MNVVCIVLVKHTLASQGQNRIPLGKHGGGSIIKVSDSGNSEIGEFVVIMGLKNARLYEELQQQNVRAFV